MAFETVSVERFLKSLGDFPTVADRTVMNYESTPYLTDCKENEWTIFWSKKLKHAHASLQLSGLDQQENSPCIVPLKELDAPVDSNPYELVIPLACGPEALIPDTMTTEYAEAKELHNYLLRRYFSLGYRRFAIGLLAAGPNLSLYYFDHERSINTEAFDIFTNKGLFLRIVAAMHHLCDKNFGLEPLITSSTAEPPESQLSLTLPADSIRKEHRKTNGSDVTLVVDIRSPIKECNLIYGPLPVVLDVLELSGCSRTVTTTYTLTAELCWHAPEEIQDERLITIQKRIGDEFPFRIPELICSFILDETELPGRSMGQWHPRTNRKLHISIYGTHGKPIELEDVKNSQKFKSVFVDLVRYHRAVYDKAHILYKNISPWKVKALLYEVVPVGHLDHWSPSGDPWRSGTCLYFAIDLLVTEETRPHRYRHDLESFFYVLVWFLESKQPPVNNDSDRYAFYNKYTSSWTLHETEKDYKLAFLREAPERQCEKLLEGLNPDFVWVVHDWFLPLVKILQDAYAIGKTEEDRDSLITYDKFMGVLDPKGRLASAQSG